MCGPQKGYGEKRCEQPTEEQPSKEQTQEEQNEMNQMNRSMSIECLNDVKAKVGTRIDDNQNPNPKREERKEDKRD